MCTKQIVSQISDASSPSTTTTTTSTVSSTPQPPTPTWKEVENVLESVRLVLTGLVNFEKPTTRRKFRENHHNQQPPHPHQTVRMSMQRVSLT